MTTNILVNQTFFPANGTFIEDPSPDRFPSDFSDPAGSYPTVPFCVDETDPVTDARGYCVFNISGTWTAPGTLEMVHNVDGTGDQYNIDFRDIVSSFPVVDTRHITYGIGFRINLDYDEAAFNVPGGVGQDFLVMNTSWLGWDPSSFTTTQILSAGWRFQSGRGGTPSARPYTIQYGSSSPVLGNDVGSVMSDAGNTLWVAVFVTSIGKRAAMLYSTDGVNYTSALTIKLAQNFHVSRSNPATINGLNMLPGSVVPSPVNSPVTITVDRLRKWHVNGLLDILAKTGDVTIDTPDGWVSVLPWTDFTPRLSDGQPPPPPPGGFADIVNRALTGWPFESVSYSQSGTYNPGPPYIDGYRPDCSGFASMAAGIPGPGPNTVSFVTSGWITRINWSDLVAGDFVGHCGPGTAGDAGHIMVVVSVNTGGGTYDVYEQNGVGLGPHLNTYTIGDDLGNSFAPYRLSTLMS